MQPLGLYHCPIQVLFEDVDISEGRPLNFTLDSVEHVAEKKEKRIMAENTETEKKKYSSKSSMKTFFVLLM